MEAASVEVVTMSGETGETANKPAGADTSPTSPRSRNARGAGTGRTIGTAQERLAILVSELGNCQKAGIKVKWSKSQTKPHRILLAIYDATPCPKCNAWLLLNERGMVICQTPGCEFQGVEYMPDELPDRLAIDKGSA